MKVTVKQKGNFEKTSNFLNKIKKKDFKNLLEKWGQEGVFALSSATPVRTGETAASWSYKVRSFGNSGRIEWSNSNINKGVPIAILIQYGHGTKNGGYVQGIDYINPALEVIFKNLADDIWKEVTSL